ncbi:adenylate/guanylate cyclase domain-containing protein [Plebeiibacterium sediminum]|uniref:Response regulator n=1 Tax=Plebeiibacterium sediminum TaxID=2992112 RepID=A0AAE3M7S2_9BACT|nr:adenylate/guanylate cyclase domain-containing protein [Plebeiobacterium sediminum]MCW3788572.1 response regulator [Plebeiobacterium sediminum]
MVQDSIKILIVDDMSIIIDIIISHLDEMGQNFIYLKASNGRDACKIALQSNPDLIIMDWEMPKMTGIDALSLLKKKEQTKNIPVIISSGFSDAKNVRQALETGAIDYIRKPIDPIELIARVRSVLALSSSINALRQKQIELEREQEKVEKILKGIIPEKIFNEVKESGYSKPQRYKNASVMFTDLVGFTQKTCCMSPKRLIDELNDIFSAFDRIISNHNCTRIKTIGDGYLAVSGLPQSDENHAINLVCAAIDFRNYIIQRNKTHRTNWEITIGINSGDIIGSLIGYENYLFDIFGENVNTASRIQGQCTPMDIAVSESTYNLTKHAFNYQSKGVVNLKGMRGIQIYNFLNNRIEAIGSDCIVESQLKKKELVK